MDINGVSLFRFRLSTQEKDSCLPAQCLGLLQKVWC